MLLLAAVALVIATGVVRAQYNHRPPDRITVEQRIKFAAGRNSAIVTRTICRGTTHNYMVGARAGQQMSVKLSVKGRTSLTIYTPTDRIWEADGVTEWSGPLAETGDYTIQVATDATARYTLATRIN